MDLRVIVPFTHIEPETEAALEASGWPYEAIDVSDSDSAYWELLSDLWSLGEGFVIVEHDIVVGSDTLDALAECSGEWCSYAAPYFVGPYHGMGCVKFSASLINRVPWALDRVAEYSDSIHPHKFWCALDGRLQMTLRNAGAVRCEHEGLVGHAHLLPSHGCVH